jgi:thioredoxin 1
MEFNNLHSIAELQDEIKVNEAVMLYFSTPDCNVCKVIKPKLLSMIEEDFPEFRMYYIDIEKSPQISGQMNIFSVPTLLIFFQGKEFYRLSRNISLEELRKTIKRPYELLF